MSVISELPRARYPADAMRGVTRGTGAFDIATARGLMWLSQLAYETRLPDKVREVLVSWGLTGGPIQAPAGSRGPGSAVRGVVGIGNGAAMVALAGTDPLVVGDYVTDLAARIDSDGVHLGFGNSARLIEGPVIAALADTTEPLLLAGHSLGGAVAVVLAQKLAAAGRPPAAVYTYGMPRPGSPAFGGAYDQVLGARTFRLLHGQDSVPTVPPAELGWAHVGRLLMAPSSGRFDASRLSDTFLPGEPPFLARKPGEALEWLKALLPPLEPATDRKDTVGRILAHVPPAFADHFPDRYLGALDRSV
jgi:hypothetical protein